MWLLKLHFSVSVLCLLAFLGFRAVFYGQIKEKLETINSGGTRRAGFHWWVFFSPVLNVMLVVSVIAVILMDAEDLKAMARRNSRNADE